MIKPHSLFSRLGEDSEQRAATYRELFRYELDLGLVDQIRSATNSNYALGSPRFAAEVANALGRRVVAGKPGRPKHT